MQAWKLGVRQIHHLDRAWHVCSWGSLKAASRDCTGEKGLFTVLLNEKLPVWTEQGLQMLESLWLALTTQNKAPKEPKLFLFLRLLSTTHPVHLQTCHSPQVLWSWSEMSRMLLAECWSGRNQWL